MEQWWIYLVVGAISCGTAWFLARFALAQQLAKSRSTAKDILENAQKEAERHKQQIVMKAKEEWFRQRDEQENKLKQRTRKMEEQESRCDEREKKLVRREETLKQREQQFTQREGEL